MFQVDEVIHLPEISKSQIFDNWSTPENKKPVLAENESNLCASSSNILKVHKRAVALTAEWHQSDRWVEGNYGCRGKLIIALSRTIILLLFFRAIIMIILGNKKYYEENKAE